MCMHVCIHLYKYKCTCVYKFMYIHAHIIKSATYIKIFVCCRSVAKSSLTLCDPMDCSLPGFSVLYHLPEFAQIHVH